MNRYRGKCWAHVGRNDGYTTEIQMDRWTDGGIHARHMWREEMCARSRDTQEIRYSYTCWAHIERKSSSLKPNVHNKAKKILFFIKDE